MKKLNIACVCLLLTLVVLIGLTACSAEIAKQELDPQMQVTTDTTPVNDLIPEETLPEEATFTTETTQENFASGETQAIEDKTEPKREETVQKETENQTENKTPKEEVQSSTESTEPATVPQETKPQGTIPNEESKPNTEQSAEDTQTNPEVEETTPPVTEPPEIIDIDTLVNYGRNYAVSTYGYEVCPGLRDGYYPAYSCRIRTMEDGYSAIRACVDDTTRALLAIPGTQIVVEIDGVACRARIDIVIKDRGDGNYSVTVYYG